MTITIQVLSNNIETKPTAKGSYQQLEVAYKNLSFNGKVEAKKLMSFGANAEAFKTLSTAAPASVWDIETFKNDKGYLDWVKVTKGVATASAQPTSSAGRATTPTSSGKSGGWETPEERAKRQVYIIRQSSLSTAVEALNLGKKIPTAEEVIELAKQFEAYVLGSDSVSVGNVEAVVSKDIELLEEDLPF